MSAFAPGSPVLEGQRACRRRLGYTVTEAEDGPAALGLQGAQAVDLIVTDLIMPKETSSVELGRQAIAVHPDPSFIYISGYADAVRAVGEKLGDGDKILSKPFTQ